MVRTSVRGANVTAFVVLLLVAACGSSPQKPTAGPTTSATAASSATRSTPPRNTPTAPSKGPTSMIVSTATRGTRSTTRMSTSTSTTVSTTPTGTTSTTRMSTSTPTAALPPSPAGRVVNRIPTNHKVVALTFDAGANGDGVNAILATLAKEKVAASFFLTGHFVDIYPTLARRMARAGRLGNHTTDHLSLPAMSEARARAQVTNAQATILRVTGEDPRPLFRFPFGDSTPRDLRLVNDLGYVAVGWTVDTLGWDGTSGGQSVSSVVQRVLTAAVPGEIVLMHVGSHPSDHSTLDADSLPRVISGLRAADYGFVTLDTLGR
jgi:peptidoglycan/xylan/chitin deacetylase (PgdA/CDA1 family)